MKKLVIVTLLVALCMTPLVPVMADELSSAKSEKSSVDSRISKLNADKKKALAEKAKLEQEKQKLANAQAAEKNAYNELMNQISAAEENLRQTDAALAEAIADYTQKQEQFKIRLKVMYQNSTATKLETLLESKSIMEFYERLHYMSIISKNDTNMINELNEAKQEVEYKKQLQQQAKELLEQKASDKQENIKSLISSRTEVESEISRSQAALKKLEDEVDALLAESKKLNGIIKNLTSKKKYVGGSMVWPCPGYTEITSRYGMRKHPILRKYKMHTGIDIGAPKNSSIVAANKGTVIMAQYDKSGGYGRMVVIDHGDGITTLYAHCNSLLVKVGAEVKQGQVIAKVGSTGLSTGYHLHFEVRKNGETQNPLSSGYLTK
ncbi:MAG: peptidoglycan DD-metalloendopeptidase family protein [Clostridiaceae bacterium]